MAFFDAPGQDAASAASAIMERTALVEKGLGADLAMLCENAAAFAFGIGSACYWMWRLALVALCAIPLLGALVVSANGAYSRSIKGATTQLEVSSAMPLEAIGAFRTVAAFGREPALLTAFSSACREACSYGLALGRAKAGLEATTAPIIYIMFGGVLWYAASLVADDMEAHEFCRYWSINGTRQDPDASRCATGGHVMTAFLSVIFGFLGLIKALPCVSSLMIARVSAKEILDAIDMDPDAMDALGGGGDVPAAGRAVGRIELQSVRFAYPARRDALIYDGLSLSIAAGQTVALVGPSGCGKSTLVALLERWYDVDGGAVLLDGADVRSLSVKWLRSQIGLVSQEPVLFSGSIGWNIALGCEGGGAAADVASSAAEPSEAVVSAAHLANADAFVRAFPDGYSSMVGEKGVQLSGGQKQRIAIARALVREPAILVLDEATSALDNESERIVQEALDAIVARQKRTTIVIAHRLSTIRKADSIAVVSGGRVVEEGPHDLLLERSGGVYRALVEAQHSSGSNGETTASETTAPTALGAEKAASPCDDDSPAVSSDAHVSAASSMARETGGEAQQATVPSAFTMAEDGRTDGDADADALPIGSIDVEKAKKEKKPAAAKLSAAARAWLWRQCQPEVWWFASGLLGSTISGLGRPVLGLLMAEFLLVFYSLDVSQMREQARLWGLVFLGMGAVQALAAALQHISYSTITERMVLRVRVLAFESILRQPVGWFDASTDRTAGALANRLSTDCFLLKALTGERAGLAAAQLAVVVAGFGLALSASWIITLCILIIVPLTAVPIVVQATVVMKFAEHANAAMAAASQTATESLLQLRTLSAFGLEESAIGRFARQLQLPHAQAVRNGIALGVGSGVAAGMVLFGTAFQYVVGGAFVDGGLLTFADLMRCLVVLLMMAIGIGDISKDASDRAEATLAARRIYDLVTTESPIDALGGGGDVPAAGRAVGRIELQSVRFAYPARRDALIYDGLSLSIAAGQTVALVGPSGCGKSTLVALLERWYDVDGGAVLLDGADVRSLSVKWLRSQIGLVSQEPVLFSGSIGWNIALGCEGGGAAADVASSAAEPSEAVVSAAHLANADAFVRAFPDGYSSMVGEKGVQLSGGQKQRIAIARALVREPAILVLDEATSALDNESERIVQEALDAIVARQKRTTIVIAHRLSTIRKADSIAVVSGGRVVEEGPHDLLLERSGGVYRALVAHAETRDG